MEARRNRFDQVRLPKWAVRVKKLVHSKKVMDWCGLPYPGHPKGCPNFNSGKQKCPFETKYITEILDIQKPMFLVWGEFDLGSHVKIMKEKHPNWTGRQCRNILYWQSRSKKQMRIRAAQLSNMLDANKMIEMGEAHGVNLYATALNSGLKLEKIKDLKICRHIAIIGWRI